MHSLCTRERFDDQAVTPAEEWLFDMREANILSDNERASFHISVAKLLFLSKRVRPDILTAVSFLTTRVQKPDKDDLRKFYYFIKTRDLCLVLAQSCINEVDVFVWDSPRWQEPHG